MNMYAYPSPISFARRPSVDWLAGRREYHRWLCTTEIVYEQILSDIIFHMQYDGNNPPQYMEISKKNNLNYRLVLYLALWWCLWSILVQP